MKNKCNGLDCEMCGNTKCPNEEKELIINGIDVSKYFIEIVDEGGSTINYKILPNFERLLVEKIFEQNQQLARLQEENEGLKSLNDFNVQKIEVLQEENEELKKQLEFSRTHKTVLDAERIKYKQALEQIRKEYTNSIFYKCDKTEEECPCHNCIILGQLDRVQNIVKIIDEVLNDRD